MRGDGTTTRQMLSSPENSVFVWCNDHLEYPKRLAHELGRDDIKIISPSRLNWEFIAGITFSGIVVDHACYLTGEQIKLLKMARYTPTAVQRKEK